MHAGDRNNLGWAFLRDHSAAEPNARNVPGFWVWAGDYSESDKPMPTHMGGFDGGMVWAAVDRNGVDAGFWAGPSLYSNTTTGTTTTKGWSLQFDATSPDERIESKDLAAPEWFRGEFPKSHPALGSVGTKESEQVDLVHPSFFGLFAPQQHGPASTGTYIFDLTDESEPDPDRAAQLQQLVRVADLGQGLCGFGGLAPALQLGVEDLETKSGGLPFAEGRAIGLGSWLAGGPFTVGVGTCQHAQTGPDGHLSPLHFTTGALFLGGGHDGPLDFRGQIDVGTGDEPGVWQRVHLDWDPEEPHPAGCQFGFGKWKWRVRLPHYVGDPGGGQPRGNGLVIESGGDRIGRGGGGGTGVVISEGDPVGNGFVTGVGLGDGAKTGLVSDGSKPTYATSPFTQSAPGYTFKPQDPTTGATMASDEFGTWHYNAPLVCGLYAFGEQQQGEWVTESATAFSHAVGQGSVMLVPGDVDPYAVARGDSVTTNYPTQLALPTGLASLALGAVTAGGVVGSGMAVTAGTGGRLDFQTLDSSGAVTATAYIPAGSSGDITAGGGLSAGGALVDGNLLAADSSGDVVDSGVATSDVVTDDGTLSSGNLVESDGSGVTDSGIASSDVVALAPAAYAFIQGNSGGTAWAAGTQLNAQHDSASTSWGNPGHFIQNTANVATQDIPVVEFAAPNHTNSGAGTGGVGVSLTGLFGTLVAGFTGRRTGASSGDLLLGGAAGGSPRYAVAARANYGGLDFLTHEDGLAKFAEGLTTDQGKSTIDGTDYWPIFIKDGYFHATDESGTYRMSPGGEPGEDTVTALGDDELTAATQRLTVYEQTLPSSGSATVTISNVIRAPGLIADVRTKVKTAVGTGGGLTDINIGDGTDADRFGVLSSFSINSETSWEDWTVGTPPIANGSAGATDVTLTPVGGTWDGGVVIVIIEMTWIAPPTF